jgi:hypothetical protein
MRYFMFTYISSIEGHDYGWNHGCVTLKKIDMPSAKLIQEEIKEGDPRLIDIVIMSIYEFKDEEDYKNFRS